MKWYRGDKYYIQSGLWVICRTNTREERVYTLWREKEWIASRRAYSDIEAKQAIGELKEVASGLEQIRQESRREPAGNLRGAD